ncbi:hypothetical protein ZIOFF_045448 [Zingiber officinale]|uniref:Uncharacterized protein n=1 Tax=Zingiber officinale TaxID=94328 RepID=A0A8J5KYA4_ZINOF|nr:hypothetical protein ZIOFF_045448 [Zingiber officinale]
MDEVAQAVAKLKEEWDQSVVQIQDHIRLIESCATSGKGTEEANSLPSVKSLHNKSLRDANLQAKNNSRKAAQEERELLLGGEEESTIRRRNLQYVIHLATFMLETMILGCIR